MNKLVGLGVGLALLSVSAPAGAAPLSAVPLTASTTTDQLVTVVSDFGNLSNPHDHFADVLSGDVKHWSVITPPGMATNGGISVATSGPRRYAALLPCQLLTFTPLATSSNTATSTNGSASVAWSPGIIDASLSRHPDAIAASTKATLVVDRRGRVHASTDLEHWNVLKVTLPSWATAAACKPVAVAFANGATTPTFGLSCRTATRSVLATSANSGATGSVLFRQLLRLQATATGFVAVEWVPALHRVVVEQFSSSLQLVRTTAVAVRQIRATAVTRAGAVLLLGSSAGRPIVVFVNKGASLTLHAPQRTRAVSFSRSGQPQALSVLDHVQRQEASLVTVRNWVTGKWIVTERFGVPVPYGSSK